MLKQIEEKALHLKRKEKKERQILKQLRKAEPRGSHPQLDDHPARPAHRRAISGLSDSAEEETAAKPTAAGSSWDNR